jgi:hypothetical protein
MVYHPLTVHVPIRGKLLLRIDGTDGLHEVGSFSQDVSVAFQPGPGEVSFSFDEKFWRENIEPKGVGTATPLRAALPVIQEVLAVHEELDACRKCRCGWQAVEPVRLTYTEQHRNHVAADLVRAGLVLADD